MTQTKVIIRKQIFVEKLINTVDIIDVASRKKGGKCSLLIHMTRHAKCQVKIRN